MQSRTLQIVAKNSEVTTSVFSVFTGLSYRLNSKATKLHVLSVARLLLWRYEMCECTSSSLLQLLFCFSLASNVVTTPAQRPHLFVLAKLARAGFYGPGPINKGGIFIVEMVPTLLSVFVLKWAISLHSPSIHLSRLRLFFFVDSQEESTATQRLRVFKETS